MERHVKAEKRHAGVIGTSQIRNRDKTRSRLEFSRSPGSLSEACSVARQEKAEAMDPVVVVALLVVCTLGLIVIR